MSKLAKQALTLFVGLVFTVVMVYLVYLTSVGAMLGIIDRDQKDLDKSRQNEQSKSLKEQEKNRSSIVGDEKRKQ
ncbi:MAG: hypothetical protein M3R13_02185 [Armatimonadota bacterium]|nr:hypothetical protein [Armatimonadota bacterium]